jgi:hypothetical protein
MEDIKHWREIDYRYDWVSLILDALESGFTKIQEMEKEIEWFDAGFQVEHAESLFGIAFITAQTYILGVVEDVNDIRESNGKNKIKKIDYYKDDHNPLSSGVSRILLINTIANYYKHQDEWEKPWTENSTVETLSEVNITENTEFPCTKMAEILFGENKMWKFENLLQLISGWRAYIISKYK